jgi:hypothetical protein
MGKKATISPEAFIKLYENWANENVEVRKDIRGNLFVPRIEYMSRQARARFDSFLFANGAFPKKAHGKFYCEEISENNPDFLMLLLRNK